MTVKPTQDEIGNECRVADAFSQLIAKQHTAKVIHCYLLSLDLQWHAGAIKYLFVNLLSVHMQGYWLQPHVVLHCSVVTLLLSCER